MLVDDCQYNWTYKTVIMSLMNYNSIIWNVGTKKKINLNVKNVKNVDGFKTEKGIS